jgi:hypothetical protein
MRVGQQGFANDASQYARAGECSRARAEEGNSREARTARSSSRCNPAAGAPAKAIRSSDVLAEGSRAKADTRPSSRAEAGVVAGGRCEETAEAGSSGPSGRGCWAAGDSRLQPAWQLEQDELWRAGDAASSEGRSDRRGWASLLRRGASEPKVAKGGEDRREAARCSRCSRRRERRPARKMVSGRQVGSSASETHQALLDQLLPLARRSIRIGADKGLELGRREGVDLQDDEQVGKVNMRHPRAT